MRKAREDLLMVRLERVLEAEFSDPGGGESRVRTGVECRQMVIECVDDDLVHVDRDAWPAGDRMQGGAVLQSASVLLSFYATMRPTLTAGGTGGRGRLARSTGVVIERWQRRNWYRREHPTLEPKVPDVPMRIHIHNCREDAAPITAADWGRASHRLDAPSVTTIGSTVAELRAVESGLEVLVASPMGLRQLLPITAPRLRIISVTWAGVDRLAPFDWVPPGVLLLNNSGAHALKAAEYVVMALLMLVNGMPALARSQADHRWVSAIGRTLAGRRLTVLGLGAIGGATATLAHRLGLTVTGVRGRPQPHPDCAAVVGVDALDGLLPTTDFLALALPYSETTANLIDRRRLMLLPAHAGVVNVGRGRTIDEDALCDRLAAGLLGGAVLDVFRDEPLAVDHRAWATPNLVVTPHMAADDPDTVIIATLDILIENINTWRRGAPMPNEFDVARGSRVRA